MAAAILSLLPALAWLWYFTRQDRHGEPVGRLLLTFAAGAILVWPAVWLESPWRSWATDGSAWQRWGGVLFVVAPLEENLKLVAAAATTWRRPELDEPVDAVIYLVAAALGFAAAENLLYARAFGLAITPWRGLFSALAHATFSGVLGVQVGKGLFGGRALAPSLLLGEAIAVLLHGTYDGLLFAGGMQALAAIGLLVVAALYLGRSLRQLAQSRPPARIRTPTQ
ncbi:MAG: PrsW family intramembrane metalloprotease [Limnochordaceae bacterium]|nr:PrsW family intramembrane metalloprotease [Limnochordaceae bacterium]